MKQLLLPALILLVFWLAGCSLAGDITPPPDYRAPAAQTAQPATAQDLLYPLVAPNPKQGASIYAEKCAPCHGPQGLGDGPSAAQIPNPVTAIGKPEVARASIPSEWYAIVRDGNMERFMPGFTSLSEGQRWDVLAYVYMLSVSDEALARSEALYQANCALCHGESGQGDGPQAASFSMPDFTNQQEMARKSTASFYETITTGAPPAMPAYADQLTDEERWALADYVRWLSFARSQASQGRAAGAAAGETPPATSTLQAGEEITATQNLSDTVRLGKVSGRVIHGSGGQVPAGLEVTIHGFDAMQLIISDTVPVQPDGIFTLPDVAMPAGRLFLATTQYDRVTYSSQVSSAQEGEDLLPLDIVIYESTTDPSALTVDRLHLFFDFSTPSVAQVIELYIISNRGNKTLVSEEENGPVLEFSLPAGATGLKFQDGVLGERYLPIPSGFADTMPVRPSLGEYQVMYAFEMPYERKLEFSQPVHLSVENIAVLFPDNGVRLKSALLRDEGTRNVQEAPYRFYSGGGLEAGSKLELTLSGRPGGANFLYTLGDSGSLAVGLGALGLALIVAGILLYRRAQDQAQSGEAEREPPAEAQEEESAESLMDAIIALDDLFQEGQLSEEAYQARRAELKARLRQVRERQGSGKQG